jgi:plasmid stability protein
MDIRIRNLDDDMHRALKAEAALKAMSLEAYIIELLSKRPPMFTLKRGKE